MVDPTSVWGSFIKVWKLERSKYNNARLKDEREALIRRDGDGTLNYTYMRINRT